MQKNTFTRNTIAILLLLCVLVTPFARDHKEDTKPTDTITQPEEIPEENHAA